MDFNAIWQSTDRSKLTRLLEKKDYKFVRQASILRDWIKAELENASQVMDSYQLETIKGILMRSIFTAIFCDGCLDDKQKTVITEEK